jgi:bacterioferritin
LYGEAKAGPTDGTHGIGGACFSLPLAFARFADRLMAMHGNEEILNCLGESLQAELTAINQYFLHSKMCENWGYFRLAGYYRKESIEEMVHAEKLINRILFLDGAPNMTAIGPIRVGINVKMQFESDLALEMDAVKQLNRAIKTSTATGDNASRALFEEILRQEEDHVDYLEGQLHAIGEVGLENYLAQQLHKGEKD